MAPKKATPALEQEPSASSSSADEQFESEEIVNKNKDEGSEPEEDEEEQSGDDEEEEEDEKKNAQNQTQKPQPSSDSENSSRSDSEADSHEKTPSPAASDFAVKPISSKPMDKPKKPTPKPSAPEPKPGTKRPAKDQNGKDGSSQNKKTKVDEEKKSNYARLWSEDDEVAILQGVLDFKTKKGSDAYTDMGAFHEFVKKDLSVTVTKNQLWDKARRLKKKYQALYEKRVNEKDPELPKPWEYKCYQLYKKIWGNDDSNTVEGTAKSATKRKATKPGKLEHSLASPQRESKVLSLPEKKSNGVVKDGKMDEEDFFSMFPELEGSLEAENMNLSVPEAVVNVVKDTMPLIGAVKAKELEEKWKNLRAEQIRLFLKQLDLVREQTKMALDAMEASNS